MKQVYFYLTVLSLIVTNAFGQSPTMVLSETEMNPTVAVGATTTQTFTITNTGNRDLTWSLLSMGEPVAFAKEDLADWTLTVNQDRISENVWITSQHNQGLFNIRWQSNYWGWSPSGTEWAFGESASVQPGSYQQYAAIGNNNSQSVMGNVISLHLIDENRYFDLLFDSFSDNDSGGGFSYTRTEYSPSWVSADVPSGTLIPGESKTVTVTFSGANMNEGLHSGSLVIRSNDPSAEEAVIPTNLTVTGGIADISANTTLAMGDAYQGYPTTKRLTINNDGDSPLNITDIVSSDPSFTFSPSATSVTIAPDQGYDLEISFTPSGTGSYNGNLTITSNDLDESPLVITMSGTGLQPPQISVPTSTITSNLASGTTSPFTLTVSNTGGSDLTYSVSFDLGTSEPVSFTKENYADPNLPDIQDRISGDIHITRMNANWYGLYNAKVESQYANYTSPANTKWNAQSRANATDYSSDWLPALQWSPGNYVNKITSMYAPLEDRYFDVQWISWDPNYNTGGFSYIRTEIYNWVTSSVASGTVPVGASQDITLIFNARGLGAGTYSGTLLLTSNDPANPSVEIPVSMTISGSSLASVYETTVTFPNTAVGLSSQQKLRVMNDGADTLHVTSIVSDATVVQSLQETLAIAPFGVGLIDLQFSPDAIQSYSGNITVETDDTNNPSFVIPFTASAVAAGEMALNLPDMTATLQTGNTTNKTIQLQNTGAGDLTWSLEIKKTTPVVTVTKEDYADWTLEANQDRISDDLWITRGNSNPLINIAQETAYANGVSPAGTKWQNNTTFQSYSWNYYPWSGVIGTPNIGQTYSLHADRSYYDVTFRSWSSDWNGAGFSYERQEVPGWIKSSTYGGTTAAGASSSVTLTYDPSDYLPGTYNEVLVLRTNDPDEPELEIPIQFTVQGVPDMEVSASALNFPNTGVGYSSKQQLEISNIGTGDLILTIASSDGAFTSDLMSDTLRPDETIPVSITFSPSAAQTYSANLTIRSNDGDIVVAMTGDGVNVADITVSPEELVELTPGGQTVFTGTISVQNSGTGDLNWAINDGSLADALSNLNSDFATITAEIPNRYDFAYDGTNNIGDGGNDMYDGGNMLNTNLAAQIPYSDNAIVDGSAYFGAGTTYFTRHLPGLFVMVADLNGVSSLSISGNNGADGSGTADGAVLSLQRNGKEYTGFLKRVYNAWDPSINQLMIIERDINVNHTFSQDTDNDFHELTGLGGITRIYYLLYAGANGSYIDDVTASTVMEKFLSAIRFNEGFSTPWLSLDNYSGTVAGGSSATLNYTIDLTGYPSANYEAIIPFGSNDPDEQMVALPVQMNLGGVVVKNPLPDLLVNEGFGTQDVDFSTVFVDGNNDPLTYATGTSDASIVTGSVSGTTLTLSESGTGTALVSVRADDGNNNVAFDDFVFRINNVPDLANPIADQVYTTANRYYRIDIASVFIDTDSEDVLTISLTNSDNSVVSATVIDGNIRISPITVGTATLTVSVDDGFGGTASDSFVVTIERGAPTITFADMTKVFGDASFDLRATTSSRATVTYSIAADPISTGEISLSGQNNQTVTILKAGTVKITASVAASANYLPAEKTVTLTISKAATAITFDGLTKTFGEPAFDLGATASSGAALTYRVVVDATNTGEISLSGIGNQTVTIMKSGTVKITASVPESANYLAAEKTVTLAINKAANAIAFEDFSKTFGDDTFELTATTPSGAVITYGVATDASNTGEVSLSGANNQMVTIVKPGTVKITASAAESANYLPVEKTVTLTINKAEQVITFQEISDVYNSASAFPVAATSTSGLTVTVAVESGPATIQNDTLTLTGEPGEVVLVATQVGDANFNAATPVTQTFTVTEDPILSTDDPLQALVETWPVPAKDHLNVTTGTFDIESLVMMDAFGRVILTVTPHANAHQLNVASLADGVYTLYVKTRRGTTVRRIIISR